MREINEVEPHPVTELDILRHCVAEIQGLAPGSHQSDPCYGARRKIKDFALRCGEAADLARNPEA